MNPYLSSGDDDRQAMLKRLGLKSLDGLFRHVPVSASRFSLENGLSEWETAYRGQHLSHQNASTHDAYAFLGAGVYDHWYPSVVDYLVSRGEFLTAYTPYQPEVSQGTLQLIYEFQCLCSRLFAMEICNASVYDGAHALVECVLMALRLKKVEREPATIVLTPGLHPEYAVVLKTYLRGFPNIRCEIAPLNSLTGQTQWDKTACAPPPVVVVGQYPNFWGVLDEISALHTYAKQQGALSVVVNNEPYVFGVAEPPGVFGVDLVATELQGLGNPIGLGGPHIGAVLAKRDYLRQLPGRLVGKTRTQDGTRVAYTLTLSTREQHIRREKATSNICTNQGLLVNRVVATLSLLGSAGYREIAQQNYWGAHLAYETWRRQVHPLFPRAEFFNEMAFRLTPELQKTIEKMRKNKVYWGVMSYELPKPKLMDEPFVLCCVTEKRLPREIHVVETALRAGV